MSERLNIYMSLLEEKPLYADTIRLTAEKMDLSLQDKLYLCSFAPPIMEFAGWVLNEAVKSGKKRLYFLSRDGYQIYLAACRLTELRKISIDCRYLYVSRYAMRIPSYHMDIPNCLNRICARGMNVTLERILKRGALTDEEAEEVAKLLGREDRYRDVLKRHQISELKRTLGRQDDFLKYIEKHSTDEYENTMGYLQQEGLLSDIPYAIVDSGWIGTLQQSLQVLIHSRMPNIRIEGYYFGLYEIPQEADIHDYHAWYFTPATGLNRKVHFSNSLFEAICSTDEGMTIGYLKRGNRYLPQFDPAGNPNSEKIKRNLEIFKNFLGYYKEDTSERRYIEGRKLAKKLFMKSMSRPAELEVGSFGEYLFSDDILAGECQAVAAQLTRKDIRDQHILRRLYIMTRFTNENIRESAWIEGSIVKYGISSGQRADSYYIRNNLRHVGWYKYLAYGRKQIRSFKAGKKQT